MPDQPVMPIPDGSVVITPAQQYAEIREMRKSLDKLVNTVDPAFAAIREKQHDHEGRLRAVERKVWIAAGFAAGAGGTVGGLLSQLFGR